MESGNVTSSESPFASNNTGEWASDGGELDSCCQSRRRVVSVSWWPIDSVNHPTAYVSNELRQSVGGEPGIPVLGDVRFGFGEIKILPLGSVVPCHGDSYPQGGAAMENRFILPAFYLRQRAASEGVTDLGLRPPRATPTATSQLGSASRKMNERHAASASCHDASCREVESL